MAESKGSLLLRESTLHSLCATLDPKSLILSQFSDSHKSQFLQLTTESFIMERGSRYKEYSDLREKRLRMKNATEQETPEKERNKKLDNPSVLMPPKKQVKCNSMFATPPKRLKGPSILTQSVPDFSSALRKENRKPAVMLPPVAEKSMTPPVGLPKSRRIPGTGGGGSKSANSSEKRNGGLMARKSYANMEELKGLAAAAGNAINGENRGGGKISRGAGKTILGYRKF